MNRFFLTWLLLIAVSGRLIAQSSFISVCSFNIQFLGSSKERDNPGLAAVLKGYDLVVVQELIAPPYSGTYPDGKPFVPDPEARAFFDCMKENGFVYKLSEEDTGPGITLHINSSATEWWVAFYKPDKVKIAGDLPSGFLSSTRAHNNDFDRVPYAFAFRTADEKLDFVLISVHLEPGAGTLNKNRRQHELASIAAWVGAHDQKEKDFIILGDMNIENEKELATAAPSKFVSLNKACEPTNTNVKSPKPYDHVMFITEHTLPKFDTNYGFHVENLIKDMEPRWKQISAKKYPGAPIYDHNTFRKYYSDHHPVDFQLKPLPTGDDD